MNSITVGELRALLANMPADAEMTAYTDGDEVAQLRLRPAGDYCRGIDLGEMQPGDTFEAIKARREERSASGSEFADFLNSLLFTPPRNTVTCSHCLRVFVFGKPDESDGSRCPLCPVVE